MAQPPPPGDNPRSLSLSPRLSLILTGLGERKRKEGGLARFSSSDGAYLPQWT